MTEPSRATRPVTVAHVRIESTKPFAVVRTSVEALVPQLNTAFRTTPLRVVLYEALDGRTMFEYNLPSSLFGQFEDDRVAEVGHKLDRQLETLLLQAAS